MYKKIKNSSFMNLIWFIIATLPILLLIIYALGFFNNEDLRTNEQDNYTLTFNSISGNTLKEETNIFQTLVYNEGTIGTYNENGSLTYTETNTFTPSYNVYNTTILDNELYLWLFSNTTNINNYYQIRYYNTDATYYNTQNLYFNNNNYGIKLLETYNNLNVDNKILSRFNIILTLDYNNEIYPIASRNNLYLNDIWFNNYKNYVNYYNTIKYNSCPISYTYNENTYNIETNNNNYLGTNETLEINQNFNYTINEQPTLNYNNYFISNAIANTTIIYGNDLGNELNLTNPNIINLNTLDSTLQTYNPNWQYYRIVAQKYSHYTPTQANLENWTSIVANGRVYIGKETNIYYEYEYYNIESTINTSLELIPNNNFNDFLTNVNNTIQTNGFISQAFLNLSQFFGVNNVYYSLACYYIEYLLVIVLLHLAFDILYMLPNICHKFMEKIGGERD